MLKPNQQIHFRLGCNRCLFMLGTYFCISAFKHNVVVVIGMGSCIHGCLFSTGAFIPILQYCHLECCVLSNLAFKAAGDSVVLQCLCNLLNWGHWAAINITWVLLVVMFNTFNIDYVSDQISQNEINLEKFARVRYSVKCRLKWYSNNKEHDFFQRFSLLELRKKYTVMDLSASEPLICIHPAAQYRDTLIIKNSLYNGIGYLYISNSVP